MSEYTSNCRITVMELREARHPAERSAALMLAVAQRDLAIARASSPADVADDPRVTDPVAEYAAWLDRMVISNGGPAPRSKPRSWPGTSTTAPALAQSARWPR